jgi:hypothetical protein
LHQVWIYCFASGLSVLFCIRSGSILFFIKSKCILFFSMYNSVLFSPSLNVYCHLAGVNNHETMAIFSTLQQIFVIALCAKGPKVGTCPRLSGRFNYDYRTLCQRAQSRVNKKPVRDLSKASLVPL